MSAAPVHHLLKEEGFFGGLLAFHADAHQMFGRQNDGVPPLYLSAMSSAAYEADIAAHNFGDDVGDEVFVQAIGIGRDRRLFLHSHLRLLPNGPQQASTGTMCNRSVESRKLQNEHSVHYFAAAKPRDEQRLFFSTTEKCARDRAYGAAT